jgi:transcriptional regulator with PAS, ATPase and Fis domain
MWSPRAGHSFIAIDCATLPEPLFESELFGHMKGAFTGAIATKKGLFEEGDGGTIFLDELEAMPLSTQVKLLRVLQDRAIRRVGGTNPIQIDIRILAATNRELKPLVEQGAFREDLYYRINGIVLTIPPLRERKEDITALAHHFLKQYRSPVEKGVRGISTGAMQLLVSYPWPGNVRELEKVIEHALVFGRSDLIIPEDLPPRLLGMEAPQPSPPNKRLTLAELEKAHILAVLHEHGWNRAQAAPALGINRATLWRKLKVFDTRDPG